MRVSRLKIYPYCECGHGSAPDSTVGSLQRSHSDRSPAVLKGFALQQRRKGGVDRGGEKGRVEEKNGETGEERERKWRR